MYYIFLCIFFSFWSVFMFICINYPYNMNLNACNASVSYLKHTVFCEFLRLLRHQCHFFPPEKSKYLHNIFLSNFKKKCQLQQMIQIKSHIWKLQFLLFLYLINFFFCFPPWFIKILNQKFLVIISWLRFYMVRQSFSQAVRYERLIYQPFDLSTKTYTIRQSDFEKL